MSSMRVREPSMSQQQLAAIGWNGPLQADGGGWYYQDPQGELHWAEPMASFNPPQAAWKQLATYERATQGTSSLESGRLQHHVTNSPLHRAELARADSDTDLESQILELTSIDVPAEGAAEQRSVIRSTVGTRSVHQPHSQVVRQQKQLHRKAAGQGRGPPGGQSPGRGPPRGQSPGRGPPRGQSPGRGPPRGQERGTTPQRGPARAADKWHQETTKNIKERLDAREWKRMPKSMSKWWQTEIAAQTNRLRSAARVFSESPGAELADYPQLVAFGDGNTGKSTVLNRFAEFPFSPVTDGVCTRRPVRLKLRPLTAKHREAVREQKLHAMCTIHDERDGHKQFIPIRADHREADENLLRENVEARASARGQENVYMLELLEIQIEADQMIYFDLLDLPGMENDADNMTRKLAKKYINHRTLENTFVLFFNGFERNGTKMNVSLCVNRITEDVEQVMRRSGHGGRWTDFLKQRCLGVVTKVDKGLESNPGSMDAQTYDAMFADKLRANLLCEGQDASRVLKIPWVAVLNPNELEQAENMSFVDACTKESWFFDELYANDLETRMCCGLANFRSVLVDLYDKFVMKRLMPRGPSIFTQSAKAGQQLEQMWMWQFKEETFDKIKLTGKAKLIVESLLNHGQDTAMPISSEILLSPVVLPTTRLCRSRAEGPIYDSTVDATVQDILYMLARVWTTWIEYVHTAARNNCGVKQYVTLCNHVIRKLIDKAKDELVRYERELNVQQQMDAQKYNLAAAPERIHSLVSKGQGYLVELIELTNGSWILDDTFSTVWLFHPDHLMADFVNDREQFFRQWRAAELLALVFDDETHLMQERDQFETKAGNNKLVCLPPHFVEDDRIWFRTHYQGDALRLRRPPYEEGLRSMDCQTNQPGFCCTPGCSHSHEVAFQPCGHTVCCWECAKQLRKCPVCCNVIMDRWKCYEPDEKTPMQGTPAGVFDRVFREDCRKLGVHFAKSQFSGGQRDHIQRELAHRDRRLPGQETLHWNSDQAVKAAEQRAADAEKRMAHAEKRAADAERHMADAEKRAADAERHMADAERRAAASAAAERHAAAAAADRRGCIVQ